MHGISIFLPFSPSFILQQIEKMCPKSNVTRLKAVCPTRWVQRHDAIHCFVELLMPILKSISEIIDNWEDRDTTSSTMTLQRAMEDGNFLFAYLFAKKCFV